MSRARSAPPELPGFTVGPAIGGGGFADVFLYTQHRPNRQVAIKVLRSEHLSEQSLRQFENEADVMAEVSAHPYIVTIYSTGVAPDGRPYIVMEHYPQPHFGARARGAQLSLPEVLRVGVQVSSAVETAHRAGILHRDIKPANILTSAYGRPGLTDFGLAGVHQADHTEAASGITVAFASPEVLRDEGSTGSVSSDVYALSATLYALLAGRSPLWIPGGDNSDGALLARGLSGSIPRLTREDLPPSLTNLLSNGLSVDPSQRPVSALALARGLQDAEQELRLPTTPLEVQSDTIAPPPISRAPSDDDGTRRAPRVVDPTGAGPAPAPSIASAPPIAPPPIAPPPVAAPAISEGPPASTTDPDTIRRQVTPPPATAPATAPAPPPAKPDAGPRPLKPVLIGIGIALVVLVGAGVAISSAVSSSSATTTTTVRADEPIDLLNELPEAPIDVAATMAPDGTLTVAFTPSSDEPTEKFRVNLMGPNGEPLDFVNGSAFVDVEDPPAIIAGFTPTDTVCVEVSSIIGSRISSEQSTSVCTAPAPAPAATP